jgi:hypothetical protein
MGLDRKGLRELDRDIAAQRVGLFDRSPERASTARLAERIPWGDVGLIRIGIDCEHGLEEDGLLGADEGRPLRLHPG